MTKTKLKVYSADVYETENILKVEEVILVSSLTKNLSLAEKEVDEDKVIEEIAKSRLNYIKEEYRDEFIRDDENESYIKFNTEEFENLCNMIVKKTIQKTTDKIKKIYAEHLKVR